MKKTVCLFWLFFASTQTFAQVIPWPWTANCEFQQNESAESTQGTSTPQDLIQNFENAYIELQPILTSTSHFEIYAVYVYDQNMHLIASGKAVVDENNHIRPIKLKTTSATTQPATYLYLRPGEVQNECLVVGWMPKNIAKLLEQRHLYSHHPEP